MSEDRSVVVWQCVHCRKTMPGVLPGSLPYCPFCARPQQPPERPLRVNPNCRQQLFNPTAEFCHKYHAPQQPPPGQQQTTHAPPGVYSQDNRQLRIETDPSLTPPTINSPGSQYSEHEQENETVHSPQQPTLDSSPPQEQEPDTKMQVSTTQPSPKGSSASEPKTPPLPPEPPPGHHSNPHPSSAAAAASSADESQNQNSDYNHPSADPPGPYAPQENPSADRDQDSDVANGNREQSSTLAQGTTTSQSPETTTSTTETPKPPSDLSGVAGHPIASEDDGEANKGGQKQMDEEKSSAVKLQTQDNDHNHPSADARGPHKKQGKPSEDRDKDSEVANGNGELSTLTEGNIASENGGNSEANKGDQKQTAESDDQRSQAKPPKHEVTKEPIGKAAAGEQEHTPPSQKLPTHGPNKQDPTADPDPHPTKRDLQPDNQPNAQMGDSSAGAAVTNPNQEQEPDTKMQVSTIQPSPKESSALEPKTPLPTEPPPGHHSNPHPFPAAAGSSADESQKQDNNHNDPSADARGPHERQKKRSEDKGQYSEVANGNGEQSTLTQGNISSENGGNSEANKGDQKQTAESDDQRSQAKPPKREVTKEPIGKAAAGEQEHTPPSQKLPTHGPNKQDPTADPDPHPTKRDLQPDNQPNAQMGDSSAGAAVTNPNQPEELLHGKDEDKDNMKEKGNEGSQGASANGSGEDKHRRGDRAQGFQAPPENSIAITFHVVVPLPFWEWEDSTSSMHIRFGDIWLGDWKDCGEFTKCRDLGDGYCEMNCTLKIRAKILKDEHPIPYKYVIHSPKTGESPDDCYEYLHEHYLANPNRSLRVPKEKYQQACGGSYHQYDTVVYPKKVVMKSWAEKAKAKLTGILWSGKTSRSAENVKEFELKPLSSQEMRKYCLEVYLDGHKKMLGSGIFPQQFDIHQLVNEIHHVYTSLYHVTAHQSGRVIEKKEGSLEEVMKAWLESIVVSLKEEGAENSEKQLVAAVYIAYCFHRCIPSSQPKIEKFVVPLLRMLCIKPDLANQVCPSYVYLCEVLPNRLREFVADAISQLYNQVNFPKKFRTDWLLALPLQHFLSGLSKPFDKPEMDPEVLLTSWERTIHEIHRNEPKSKAEAGFVQEKFEEYKQLFLLDPLLLQVFIYISPKKDIPTLLERIPPYQSTTWLALQLHLDHSGSMNKNKASEWTEWMGQIKRVMVQQHSREEATATKLKRVISMVKASQLLYNLLSAKLKHPYIHCVDVLKDSISLVLFSIAQLNSAHPSEERSENDGIAKAAFSELHISLWKWITDPAVIGGSLFGGRIITYTRLDKAEDEFKIWQCLLSLECPPDHHVKKEWQRIAKLQIQKRTSAVSDNLKVDLVRLLDRDEGIHPILTETLMEAGTQAVDNLFLKPEHASNEEFERITATESRHVGELLGGMLRKRYPYQTVQKPISLDDLLGWNLWPNFIQIYGSESQLKLGLPDDCQAICCCALMKFQEVCSRIQSGDISVSQSIELQKILDEQVKRLCKAVTVQGDNKGNSQLSFKAFQIALQQRLQEFHTFEQHRSYLSHLCNHLSDTVQGLPQLKQELKKNFNDENINTLCVRVREGQKIRVNILCLQSARSLSAFAAKFCIMTQKHTSNLFDIEWKAAMDAAVRSCAGAALTLADIHSKVWDPAFRNCQSLLQELHDRSIKLSRIDVCFKRHECSLEMQLTSLFAGVNACLGETKSAAWIGRVVCHIHDYWNLCNHRKAASAFLDLKKALNLQKGDFSDVEKLATEVPTSGRDQTLEAVDEKLVKTGRFLEYISNDPRKLQCLNHFAQCQEVIQWLREVTNDVNDLQNFVNVALATAAGGEDDLAHDKLSDLRTVGSGFGALIYKLPDDAGYAELAQGCRSLLEALQNNHDLPNKLMYCNQQLEWYKSIKEIHGSVEVTSIGKLRTFLAYGNYRVGSCSTKMVHGIQDMIHLKLENTRKQLPKTSFTLDDLRDLESKLVLITGSKSENRKEVDKFLNTLHSVCRIADVLLALQQKGNVKYTGWVLSFHCGVDMVDTLQQQAKDMEEDLLAWEDQVRQTREQYYELNYYTTLQLLTLRKELGRLKTSGQPRAHTQIDPHVLALLESISNKIKSSDVWEVLKNVITERQGGGRGGGSRQLSTQYHPSAEKTTAKIVGPTSQVIESVRSIAASVRASTSVLAKREHLYPKEREANFTDAPKQKRALDREATLNVDEKAEESYLMLPELGRVLEALRGTLPAAVPSQRYFPTYILGIGVPNLLVTKPENVLKTVLALYMYGDSVSLPLPTFEEVLVCNPATTTEEVALLWRRAIGDPGFKRIFCLLHAEKLSYQVCDQALRSLTELSHGRKQNYRLVIICSNKDEDKSHIISLLSPHKKNFTGLHDISKYREYLKHHFTGTIPLQSQSIQFAAQGIQASIVDSEHSCVRVVSSTRSGMGKSLFITRMADRLRKYKSTDTVHVIVPVHGPVVTMDTVMEGFKDHMKEITSTIFHFDIAPSILWEVDTILFSLLVLQGLVDSQGRVWRNHPTQLYAIEVTLPEQPEQQDAQHTIPENCTLALLELFPSVECLSPRQAIQSMKVGREDAFKVVMDRQEFESTHYQRVYQYLCRHAGSINLDRFSYTGNVEGNPAMCLETILHSCGLHDPSWAEIRHFVNFLDIQLQSCEESVFCNEKLTGDVMAGLKGFVVKFMIRMSRDFATSSLCGEVVRDKAIGPVRVELEDLEQYQIVEQKRWERSSHPYIFFNQDGMSITFVGFKVTHNGDLIDPTRGSVLEKAIMTSQLYTGLIQNRVNFDENYRTWQKGIMIEKISTVMGIKLPHDPDESYVLTVDNLIKILAIQMRFRCGIPVVIMGETGCGKTRLIRYMCDLARQGMDRSNMLIMKVHGGITESDIKKFVEKAQEEALVNRQHNLDTVVFFDEANTTDAIGLIKEIMCDHRLHGRPISRNLKFIAACNPYRKHSEDMIEKLESAGLGFYVRATGTQQKLGRIPLRQLVYRVLDLPPSMRSLVYDFGQLTDRTEEDYTRQIVSDHVKKNPALRYQESIIAKVLAWSQKYMRNRKDECSFVSLRDVERAMIVFEYFYDKMNVFGPRMDNMAARDREMEEKEEVHPLPYTQYRYTSLRSLRALPRSPDPITRSLLLAISVCYHARLQEREDYEKGVAAQFVAPLGLPGGAAQFRNEIRCCQEVVLDSMTLGPNIAKNAALRENVFMMVICIELRIPLFLVGKPGSSKSLAKSIVQSSMQGTASNSELLRGFKQVHIFSYQCSQLSTSESVIEVFNTAKRFQKDQDTSKYVSVVVLDEVGLAEDSPNLPLKALHPLLEDGTEGADEQKESIHREKRVAFIGISNWALDPAKMNRGVMVTRGNPDTKELQLSARGICSNREFDPVKRRLEGYFEPLAEAYKQICRKQKREFFGLRDFYCLIKMLYWMCEKSGRPLTWPQLEHAIYRNFGGMESDELDPLEEFKQRIHIRGVPDLQSIPKELHPIVNPDCSRLGLIKTSLMTKETSWHGENRYLLFLTENYTALDILQHYLSEVVCASPPDSVVAGSDDSGEKLLEKMEPFILFGSSFPKDKEYTQVCRNINQIKICLETGRTVILLNLENLYESLYDALNQYYIYHGGSRYIDLGLQTHRVKCRVHDNFKLIVIAEKKTVYEKFPTPLINRLEKHFVLASSMLTEGQLDVLYHFQEWIHQFSSVTRTSEGQKFTEGDAFISYQRDTPAAVVFQATHLLREEGQEWKEAVLKMSQYLLLLTASPDALVRLEYTSLADQREELSRIYFQEQHHNSIQDFLAHHIQMNSTRGGGLLMQVTTHSRLLSRDELDHIGNNLFSDHSHVHVFSLQEFDTELDFSNKVGSAFQRKPGDTHHSLLVIQCDSGHLNADLIACARYRIYDKRVEASRQNKAFRTEGHTHVLFIIHLPRQVLGSSLVGFQGDPWISAHIDVLRPTTHDMITLHEAMGMSISHLFYGEVHVAANKSGRYLNAQFRRLHDCIQPAASRLQDSSTNKERATKRVAILVSLIPRDPSFPLDDSAFYGILVRRIHQLLSERDLIREDEKHWVLNQALNTRKLQNGGTFQNVLARKLDEVLVPIFSEIIAVVDRNYNLDRLDPKNENSPLSRFWIAMFRNSAIVQLRYEDMATQGGHREQVPGAGGRMAEEDFKCQLPFSWLVKESVDAQWHSAKSTTTGSTWRHLHSQLCEVVSQTAVGDVLGSVRKAECEEFFQHYLHDFVRSVYRCYHKQEKSKNLEYKLLSDALNCLVHGPHLTLIDGRESLISRIAALHVVYHFSRSQVLWFGQLVSNLPGIMTMIGDKVHHGDREIMLHLYAVDYALGSLEPPLGKKKSEDNEKATLIQWLNQVRLLQNAINSILSLPSQSKLANRTRMKWQLIRALQMFVEHIILKHEGMLPYARQLHSHLKQDPDFLKASTVDRVKKHLNSMDNQLRGKPKSQLKQLTPIQRSCRTFFMELVSSLCFGANSAPEPDLIRMLINMVFTERQEAEVGTRDFSPYHEIRSDEVPIIRSFLLRLLLEHNTEQVKVLLEEYFRKSQRARGKLDQNLCLLCIQCFEDALNKEYSLKPSQERATGVLEEGHQALQLHTNHCHGEISLGYIEGVAKVRFALSVVAEQFHKHVTMKPVLLHAVRTVCTDPTVSHIDNTGQTDTTGPLLYLVKLIVRQFGFPCLTEVSVEHPWVMPHELNKADEEQQTIDPFVIYNPLYWGLRKCVSGAVYRKQFQQLSDSTRDLAPQDVPLLLLALYEKATLSRASALPSRQLLPDVLEELDKFIKECRVLSKELQWMARSLVANEQGGPLAQLGVAPLQPLQYRILGALVVHTAAVFFGRQRVEILQPFVNMLNNPGALVDAYLPTMPEDYLLEAKRVLLTQGYFSGAFYECPRGHPYYVGECGRPTQELTCNECGARIGGLSHKLIDDNRQARSEDNTKTGYPLGKPDSRSTVPSPERGLSQAACCIVRALMHSALLWASCNNEHAMEGLMQLVKENIRPRDLPEFFWHHLECDIELLGTSIGRSMDESAITIHLVLREILQRDPPTSAEVSTVASLAARDARQQWENIFNQNYIQPILQELEKRVTEAMHNDDEQEHDQLFCLVHERVQVNKGNLYPHLWAYRYRITLEHLSQTLQQQNMKKCPILYAFLQEEPNLRATQYLPDIVRLQQYLYDSFHHRIDRREARTITIGDFLQSRQPENIRNEYQAMVESLQKAWKLVGDKLRDHTRLRVDKKHLLPSLTLDTPLEYLIPTTTGAGACTTALTDFLVLTHNNFIENCRSIVSEQYKSEFLWQEHKVPITHIHGCHLLTYEQQLPSIVLSHCHYSLIIGKGQDISYDLPALEKQLLDRFIHGKPLILSDIPQVAYQKDVYTAATFAAVRKNVTQEPLPSRMQQEIIQELCTPDRLRETLDVVDIVLGFLSSGGGKADRRLGEYIHHTLKMKRRPFSEKAREYCTLGHVLSLWEVLSVELARQLTLHGQEPFDSESMPLHFLVELTADQKKALNHPLSAIDLDKLLGALYVYIETHVRHSPLNEKEWPLVDTLEVFLERSGLPEIKDFRDEFPDSVTLAQSVAVWKHIVTYQKKLGAHGTFM